MFSLTYVSSASQPFTQQELKELLTIIRSKNERTGLTGLLLYKDGNFMQVLEGEKETVLATKQRIEADPRHKGLQVLLAEECAERTFPDWSMGFRDLRTPESQRVPGYNDFLNTSLTSDEFRREPTRAKKLLLSFKSSM